jgi:hypothetical protein
MCFAVIYLRCSSIGFCFFKLGKIFQSLYVSNSFFSDNLQTSDGIQTFENR